VIKRPKRRCKAHPRAEVNTTIAPRFDYRANDKVMPNDHWAGQAGRLERANCADRVADLEDTCRCRGRATMPLSRPSDHAAMRPRFLRQGCVTYAMRARRGEHARNSSLKRSNLNPWPRPIHPHMPMSAALPRGASLMPCQTR
jgi:hypothetical protein